MRLLKGIFKFYISSSIHVALAVCSLSYITLLTFDLPIDKILLLFTFFASISGYNFVKYYGLAKFHHRKLSRGLRYIQIFSLISFLSMVYFSFQLQTQTLLYLIVLATITFFYAIPFLPKKIFLEGGTNLRAVSGLKVYIIALVWAMATVIVPFINANHTISLDAILTTIQRFLFVLVAIFPFEISDMQYDDLKLGTIPQKIGVKNTKIIGVVLLITFFFLEFFKDTIHSEAIIVLLIVIGLSLISLWKSHARQSEYFTTFWVESIPMVWLIFLLLLIA